MSATRCFSLDQKILFLAVVIGFKNLENTGYCSTRKDLLNRFLIMNLDRFLPHFERRQQNRYDELKEPHLLTKIPEMGMSSHGYKDIWINVDFWGFLSEIAT